MRLSRRQWIGTTAAWAVAGIANASTGENQQRKRTGVRFGVRTPLAEKTIRGRALLLQRLGYDGLELGEEIGPEWLERPPEAVLKDLEGTGIVISVIVGSIKLLDPDPRIRAQAIETWGEANRARLASVRLPSGFQSAQARRFRGMA